MCGVVGYVGQRSAVDVLLRGLKRLEYRGYDSAGVAFFRDGRIEVRKSSGKLSNVEKQLAGETAARCGIGHTRWATHGAPTTQNAHPHATGHVVLVHNGIIENYQAIKADLAKRGVYPKSETDSELFGYLVLSEMDAGQSLQEAVRRSFSKLAGSGSVVVMSEKEPGTVVGISSGLPLVAGKDPMGGVIVASDPQPILEYTNDVYFLENGDMVVAREDGLEFFDYLSAKKRDRQFTHLDWSADAADKQGFAHYMLKEICEQPQVFVDTLNGVLDRGKAAPYLMEPQPGVEILRQASDLTLVACGTSWHAALLAKYWLEKSARIAVNVELASEFRYRDPVLGPKSVVVGISQSGETADTLAVMGEMRRRGVRTIAVTNVRGSMISRETDATFLTMAGPEIGVAATKTFFAQMVLFSIWSGFLGLRQAALKEHIAAGFDQFLRLPHLLEQALQPQSEVRESIRKAAQRFHGSKGFFFIGRGESFPIALEGALKLKEIAYIHAEGYAAGELKHGPIAMIDPEMVVVALAPRDRWYEKTISNLQVVRARGAQTIGVGTHGDEGLKSQVDHFIPMTPSKVLEMDESLFPYLLTPVVQLLSYEIAVLRGTDVDQPRNLAKSVTVE